MITKEQIKRIYTLGGRLDMVEHGNKEDNLHLLVEGITSKSSVSQLTTKEAAQVIKELLSRSPAPYKKTSKKHVETLGGLTAGQQKKIWALMYELAKYDSIHSTATIGERLVGIIKKELHIDATAKEPFKWISNKNGFILTEKIKYYISTARSHATKRSGTG